MDRASSGDGCEERRKKDADGVRVRRCAPAQLRTVVATSGEGVAALN